MLAEIGILVDSEGRVKWLTMGCSDSVEHSEESMRFRHDSLVPAASADELTYCGLFRHTA